MHYKSKIQVKLGGWYVDKDGAIYIAKKCSSPCAINMPRLCKLIVLERIHPHDLSQSECWLGFVKQMIVRECTAVEILFHSL